MFKFVKSFFLGNISEYIGNPGDITIQNDGTDLSYHDGVTPGGLPVVPPVTLNITPLAGGSPNGTPLNYGYNVVNCAATNYDSVLLPPAIPGTVVTLICNQDSDGSPATIIGVWPQPNDSVNGLTGDFLYWAPNLLVDGDPQIPQTTPCICVCGVAGQWISNVELA